MCLSTAARRNTPNQLRSIRERLLGMKRALLTVKPWQMTFVFLLIRMLI